MRKRLLTLLLITLLLSACATSPDVTNDPRGGGLFGGMKGLLGGDYDARVKQRQDSLAALEKSNKLVRTNKPKRASSSKKKRTTGASRKGKKSKTKKVQEAKPATDVSAGEVARLEEEKQKLERELEASVGTYDTLSGSSDAYETDDHSTNRSARAGTGSGQLPEGGGAAGPVVSREPPTGGAVNPDSGARPASGADQGSQSLRDVPEASVVTSAGASAGN